MSTDYRKMSQQSGGTMKRSRGLTSCFRGKKTFPQCTCLQLGPSVLFDPWCDLQLSWTAHERDLMRDALGRWRPHNLQKANILITGAFGAGKSCYINSLSTALNGVRKPVACSGGRTGDSQTQKVSAHVLTRLLVVNEAEGVIQKTNFVLHDTPGLRDENTKSTTTVHALLRRPEIQTTDEKGKIKVHQAGASSLEDSPASLPLQANQMHTVVIVVAADSVKTMSAEMKEKLREIKYLASEQEIQVVALLTKVDLIKSSLDDKIQKIYYTNVVGDKVAEVADMLGMEEANVIPVKNYNHETGCHQYKDILILSSMLRILEVVQGSLDRFIR